ncbi:sigma-70 family RNA polymerase sigma factor [Streptomyces tanashiensis]
MLNRLAPDDSEVAGLLALMLLRVARSPVRSGLRGELVPQAEQDRGSWNGGLIAEGVELISRTLPQGRVGPYQIQAAIAAVHDEAGSPEATDWPQILALYELLESTGPNPMVTLNRAVAVAMVHGPRAGLELLDGLAADRLLAGDRLLATRAHLLELLGDREGAASAYREAARHTTSAPSGVI